MTGPRPARSGLRWLPAAILIGLIAAVATFFVAGNLGPQKYSAHVALVVRRVSLEPVNPALLSRTARNYAALIGLAPRLQSAVLLASRADPDERQPAQSVSVSCSEQDTSSVFSCSVRAAHPHFAVLVANDLARAFARAASHAPVAPFSTQIARTGRNLRRTEAHISLLLRQLGRLADGRITGRQAAVRAGIMSTELGIYRSIAGLQSQRLLSLQALQVSRLRSSVHVSVVAPATTASTVSSSEPIEAALVAFLVFALLTMAVGFAYDVLRPPLIAPDALAAALGLPVVASIPIIPRGGKPEPDSPALIVRSHPASGATEAFQVLRISVSSPARLPRFISLSVTSDAPGEGKSTVAVNLAGAFAEAGYSVIIADMNLRHPSLGPLFGCAGAGVSDLLATGWTDLRDHLYPSTTLAMNVLPAGLTLGDPVLLLGGPRLPVLITQLRALADVLILDGPCTDGLVDAVLIADRADQVLIVSRAARGHTASVIRARNALHALDTKPIQVVINAAGTAKAPYPVVAVPRTSTDGATTASERPAVREEPAAQPVPKDSPTAASDMPPSPVSTSTTPAESTETSRAGPAVLPHAEDIAAATHVAPEAATDLLPVTPPSNRRHIVRRLDLAPSPLSKSLLKRLTDDPAWQPSTPQNLGSA